MGRHFPRSTDFSRLYTERRRFIPAAAETHDALLNGDCISLDLANFANPNI